MLRVGFEREEDGRWIAEIAELPGVMAYGQAQEEAQVLALRVCWPSDWSTARLSEDLADMPT